MASGYGFDESTKAAFAAMATHVNALVESQSPTDTTPITQRLDDIISLIAKSAGINPVSGGTCSAATSSILSALNSLTVAQPSSEMLDIQKIITKWCADSANKGFPDAQLPELTPLLIKGDYGGDVEGELRDFAVQMFRVTMASRAFDASVLGAAQLGSADLVRFALAKDGLALANSDIDHQSMRYLYKAWMSRNKQGRGLHFLRTYLQVQFGSGSSVKQLWHEPNAAYPTALRTTHKPGRWLTSRVSVGIQDSAVAGGDTGKTMSIIGSVLPSILPARLIPMMTVSASGSVDKATIGVSIGVQSNGSESRIPSYANHREQGFVECAAGVAAITRLGDAEKPYFLRHVEKSSVIVYRSAIAHTRLKEAA